MALRYVNTALSSNGDGSASSPWNRIPDTVSGAANVLNTNDEVFIQVGSHTFGERLTVSRDNTKFKPWYAYGEGDPLVLDLPVPRLPWLSRKVKTNRGLWTVRNSTGGGACVAYGTNRIGVQIDSCHVIGDAGSGAGVSMGISSTVSGTGNSLTNSRVSPNLAGSSDAITVATLNALLYRVKFDGSGSDTIKFTTTASNSNRAGSIDRVLECDIGPANQATLTGAKTTQVGDEIQYQNGALNAGLGNLIVKGCRLFKNSAGKQTILIGGQGWSFIQGNLLQAVPSSLMTGLGSEDPNGSSIMLNAGWGRNIIIQNALLNDRNGFSFANSGIAAFRVVNGQDVTDSTQATTDDLFMSNLLSLDGASAVSLGETVNGGSVRILGNTSIGEVQDTSGNNGATAAVNGFVYDESENAWLAVANGYAVNWNQLSSAFSFRNNRYGSAALGWRVMGTTYPTAAAGLAALAGAGCDVTGSAELLDALVNSFGQPLPESTLIFEGDPTLPYRRAIMGNQCHRHIGAFGTLAARRIQL